MAINNAEHLWLKRVDPIMHKHTEKTGVRADITTNMLVLELGITSYLPVATSDSLHAHH